MDVEYVGGVTSTENLDPRSFYKGVNKGFSAVEQNLDVRRHLGDTILAGHFLADESGRPTRTEVILLKAHAGAGKSVLMRRIAWDAARDYDKLCLFLKPHGVISVGSLQELVGSCKERIYLFVDDSADHVRELQSLLKTIGPEGKLLTALIAERINEWNIVGDPIAPYVTSMYELKYLSSREIDALLTLLADNDALHNLSTLSWLSMTKSSGTITIGAVTRTLLTLCSPEYFRRSLSDTTPTYAASRH
jgi:hypothetical protein